MSDLNTSIFPTWCPGCGDFSIWSALKKAIQDLQIPTHKLAIVYGIGCSGNMASSIKCFGFHGLHGRGIPVAEGIKLSNHKLHVIVVAGDGDLLGEGLNHFISTARYNHDITVILHNNQVYGLTTGQSSPTALLNTKGKTTPLGVVAQPINPVSLALNIGASHVNRGFSGDIPELTNLIKNSINHSGFSLIDVLQPCVTFNKLNTYNWFRERLTKLDKIPLNQEEAQKKAGWENDRIHTGTFIQEKKAGNVVKITIWRNGKTQDLSVKLGSTENQ